MNPSFLNSLPKLVLGYLSSLATVGALIYFMLKKTLEKAIDSRFDERLENVKHQLQLEHQKMSVVYDQQKDSLRKVLIAMHDATRAITRQVQGEGDEWLPISEKHAEEFSRVMSEESLFMDGGSDHALRLFHEIMWTSVRFLDTYPRSDEVWRAYNQMKFISERLAEHFRMRVGLEPITPNPLLDIEVLGACTLIDRFNLPNKSITVKHGEVGHLVASVRENPDPLRSDLLKLRQSISGKDSSFFFEALTQIERYLRTLDALTT